MTLKRNGGWWKGRHSTLSKVWKKKPTRFLSISFLKDGYEEGSKPRESRSGFMRDQGESGGKCFRRKSAGITGGEDPTERVPPRGGMDGVEAGPPRR